MRCTCTGASPLYAFRSSPKVQLQLLVHDKAIARPSLRRSYPRRGLKRRFSANIGANTSTTLPRFHVAVIFFFCRVCCGSTSFCWFSQTLSGPLRCNGFVFLTEMVYVCLPGSLLRLRYIPDEKSSLNRNNSLFLFNDSANTAEHELESSTEHPFRYLASVDTKTLPWDTMTPQRAPIDHSALTFEVVALSLFRQIIRRRRNGICRFELTLHVMMSFRLKIFSRLRVVRGSNSRSDLCPNWKRHVVAMVAGAIITRYMRRICKTINYIFIAVEKNNTENTAVMKYEEFVRNITLVVRASSLFSNVPILINFKCAMTLITYMYRKFIYSSLSYFIFYSDTVLYEFIRDTKSLSQQLHCLFIIDESKLNTKPNGILCTWKSVKSSELHFCYLHFYRKRFTSNLTHIELNRISLPSRMRLIENKRKWFWRRCYSIVLNNNHNALCLCRQFSKPCWIKWPVWETSVVVCEDAAFFERPAPD